MNTEFWLERWTSGQIGFHEGHPNQFLARFADRLAPAPTVLVPLCGKSADLHALAARGHRVLGVELSSLAAEAFFSEYGLTPARTTLGPFALLTSGPISILVGDFFALDAALLQAAGGALGLYDRAAVVALPPPLRTRYAQTVAALLPAASPGLVVTFSYPQPQLDGPPFAVSADDLRTLYPTATVTELATVPVTSGRLGALGSAVEQCTEVIFGVRSPSARP